MPAVIGHLLPLGLAVALSSTPLLITVLLLLSPKRRSAPAFLIGWVLGLLLVTVAFAAALTGFSPGKQAGQPLVAWVEIVLGVALFVWGVWNLFHPRPPRQEEPAWLKRVGTWGFLPSFGVGLLLNIRPKALVLATAAGIALSSEPLSPTAWAICLGIYVLIGVSTVAIPVVMTFVSPKTMMKPLRSLRVRIITSARTISIVVLLMIGALLIGSGMSRL